jgi:hypothetical protein
VQAKLLGNRQRKTPHTGGGAFVLTRLLVCGHCGAFLLGGTRHGKRVYACGGYLRYGKAHCNIHSMHEAPLLRLLIRKLQEVFLDPNNLQKLRDEMRMQETAARSEDNVQRLQKRADQLEKKIRQGGERLLILPREVVATASAALVRLQKEQADVLEEIRRAETDTPVDDLEQRIADAEKALWSLQDALRAEDWPLLRQVLRETFARVELFWTHRVAGKRTMSQLDRGVIYVRPQRELMNLSREANLP